MKYLLLMLLVVLGCTQPNNPNVEKLNRDTLAGPGYQVGTLPNGKPITRYRIDNGYYHPHYIYIIGKSITTNQTVSQGKTTRSETISAISSD